MKSGKFLVIIAGLIVTASQSYAVDFYKANNATALNQNGSWVNFDGTPVAAFPNAANAVVIWDNRVTGTNGYVSGANVTWGEIKIADVGVSKVTIKDNNLTLAGIGGIGIDMSSATADLQLEQLLTLSGPQQWILGNGKTLTIGGGNGLIGGGVSNGNVWTTNTVTVTGSGNLNIANQNGGFGMVFATDSTFTGTLTVGGANAKLQGSGKLSGITDLVLSKGNLFIGGSFNTTGNGGVAMDNRINTAANLTMGGNQNGGGTFQMLSADLNAAQSQTLSNLTIKEGYSNIALGTGNTLIFTGTYLHPTMTGVIKFSNGSQTQFSRDLTAATGDAVTQSSEGHANDILYGAVMGNADDFVKATSGVLTAATYSSTFGAGLNTNITTGTTAADGSVAQSLRLTSNLTLAGVTTVQSGGILAAASATITGGTLQAGAGQAFWITGESNRNLTINSSIVDNGGPTILGKYGGGQLTLGGSNSFTGEIYLGNSGALIINNKNALGGGTANIVSAGGNSTITFGTADVNIQRNILAYRTEATLLFNTGAFNATVSGNMTTVGNNLMTLEKQGTGTMTISGSVQDFTTLKATAGELVLTGTFNAFSYEPSTGLTISGGATGTTGILTISGNGALLKNGGNIAPSAAGSTLIFNIKNNGYLYNNAGLSLGNTASGTLIMNLANSGSAVFANAGLNIANAATASVQINMQDNSLFSVGGDLNVNNGSANSNVVINLADSAMFKSTSRIFLGKAASTTTTLNQNGGTVQTGLMLLNSDQLAGNVGTYNLNGGLLDLNTNNTVNSNSGMIVLGAGATMFANSGTIRTAGTNNNLLSTTTTGTGHFYIKGGGLTVDASTAINSGTTVAFEHDSSLGGSKDGGLTKKGAGTLLLMQVNTYTGDTIVSAGTLQTNAVGTLGFGNVTVAAGATLVLGNNISLASTSIFSFVYDQAHDFLANNSQVSLNYTGDMQIASLYNTLTGLYVNPGTYTSSQLNTMFGGYFLGNAGATLTVLGIPEPSTWVLMIAGGLVLTLSVYKRRKNWI